MNYFVHVTDKAGQDLGESFDYIDLTLKNPLAADVLVDTAEKKLAQLSTFPKRYPVVRDPFLASLGIRFVPVQSYLAFYQVDEAAQTRPYPSVPLRQKQLGIHPEDRSCTSLNPLPDPSGIFSFFLQFNEVFALVKHFFGAWDGFACTGGNFVLSYA